MNFIFLLAGMPFWVPIVLVVCVALIAFAVWNLVRDKRNPPLDSFKVRLETTYPNQNDCDCDGTPPFPKPDTFKWQFKLVAVGQNNPAMYKATVHWNINLPELGYVEITPRSTSGPIDYVVDVPLPYRDKWSCGEHYKVKVHHAYLAGTPSQDPPQEVYEPRRP